MGKVIEKIKLTNFETGKSVEVDGLIDTGATMLVLPQTIVDELGLRTFDERTVRYADNRTERRPRCGILTVEVCGRSCHMDALAGPEGSQTLVGQIVLEQLDLLVDSTARKVLPNPRSPDIPMVDVL